MSICNVNIVEENKIKKKKKKKVVYQKLFLKIRQIYGETPVPRVSFFNKVAS